MLRNVIRKSSLVLLAVCVLGCGKPKIPIYPVTGKVTFNGEALPDFAEGSVLFMPTGGGPSSFGRIEKGGVYKLETPEIGDGAIPGKHLVMISAFKSNGPESAMTELLPSKFGSEQSGLTAEVQAKTDGPNVIDFKLEGVAPKPKRAPVPMP